MEGGLRVTTSRRGRMPACGRHRTGGAGGRSVNRRRRFRCLSLLRARREGLARRGPACAPPAKPGVTSAFRTLRKRASAVVHAPGRSAIPEPARDETGTFSAQISCQEGTGRLYYALGQEDALGLPFGRHVIDVDELRDHFCELPDASLRQAIWADWETATSAIRGAIGPIAACWMSGSFFTTKEQPDDLDCVYVIHHEVLGAVPPGSAGENLINVMTSPQVRFRDVFGLRVDAYILPWWPRPGVLEGSIDRVRNYLGKRGYWDDLWCRVRDSNLKLDSLPRRGYVEVIVDGYAHP